MPQVKSKFKHAAVEKELANEGMYSDLVQKFYTQGDTNFCSASAKYLCAHGAGGGGPMMVMELGKPGRKARDNQKLVSYHSNKVHISQWSPHSDRLLASGDDDGNVAIQFFDDAMFSEDGLLKEPLTEPTQSVNTGFKKAVTGLAWHPAVQNLLAVCSKEKQIAFFDATSGEKAMDLVIETDAPPLSLDWSWDGDHLCFIEKSGADHTLCLWNVRKGEKVFTNKLGMKAAQCVFMNSDEFCYVAATGVAAESGKRFFKVFNLDGSPVGRKWSIPEKGSQAIMPFWDAGRQMMWYYGKGDLSISFALWRPKKEEFFSMGLHRSKDPIRGGCFVNQRAMDVLDCEIQCFCALTDKGGPKVAPFKFSVPRRQKTSFAPELYPDCAGLKPICTIEEYMNGAEITKPYFMSMDPDVVIGDDGAAVFVAKKSYGDLEKELAILKEFITSNKAALEGAGLDLSSLPL